MAYSVQVSTLGILQNIYDEESLGFTCFNAVISRYIIFLSILFFFGKISIISQVKAHTLKAAVCWINKVNILLNVWCPCVVLWIYALVIVCCEMREKGFSVHKSAFNKTTNHLLFRKCIMHSILILLTYNNNLISLIMQLNSAMAALSWVKRRNWEKAGKKPTCQSESSRAAVCEIKWPMVLLKPSAKLNVHELRNLFKTSAPCRKMPDLRFSCFQNLLFVYSWWCSNRYHHSVVVGRTL